jgi:hypothetical protein
MTSRVPPVHLQPPSVDFIDNRLADFHDAFKNSQSQYDHVLGKYIPAPMTADIISMHAPSSATKEAKDDERPAPRQALPVAAPMVFWERSFESPWTDSKPLSPTNPKIN